MGKVTTCREAIAAFEKANGVVAAEAEKVNEEHCGKLSERAVSSALTLTAVPGIVRA